MRVCLLGVFILLACPLEAREMVRLGVFGTVDNVDPLVVAGREIAVPGSVPVISPLGPGQEIALGDTLAIVAKATDGSLVATRILQVFPIIGPLRDVTDGSGRVMGTSLHLPPDSKARAGQVVALSGLWSGQRLITTRLRRLDWDGFAQLVGTLEAPEVLQMGSTRIVGADPPQEGFGSDIWILSGEAGGTELRVRLMAKGLFGGAVDLALWQGYASQPIASQTYMIHGTGTVGTARDAQMPPPGSLVIRCAQQGRVVSAPPEGLEEAFALLECARHIPAD